MKYKPIGNSDMPDFKQLEDRIIAKPTSEPFLVIKTNLDPKEPSKENPYYTNADNNEDLTNYFEGK